MRSGQQIGNRSSGETLTMLASAEETQGATEFYEVLLPPHRQSPPLHYHVAFTETFAVLEGTLAIYVGPERWKQELAAGESITVEKLQWHTFENAADIPCRMTVASHPAGTVAEAFQLAYYFANRGGAAADGLPRNPIVRLRFIDISQGFLPRIPLPAQRTILAVAKLISRATGIEARLQKAFQ